MLTITRKPLGMWLVAVFALGASLLTSILVPSTAHAALAATWVDKNTITVPSLPGLTGTVTFKGPSTETLPYTPSGAPAKFQVFSYGGGQWIIYFPDGTDLNTATTATYLDQNDPLSGQKVTFAKTLATVIAAPTPTPTPTPADTGGTPTPVCDVGGLSFLLCPLINLVEGLVRTVGDIIGSMMNVNPLPLSGGPVFNAWSNVLNIANVVLAIAFLFVIFAQATSMALSSYSIKRMLPKIIAAAILMNLSYYICAFAIDLSNLAGNGITSMFMTVSAVKGPGGAELNSSNIGSLMSGVMTVAVTAIAVAGIVAVLLFVALVPTTIAILAVLFVLAARQAVIILLVMIAPLAFALWVLPNTEKYFKKWWEWFMQMLVLYPMVMALFAAAIVASNVIAQTTEQPKVDDFNKVTDSNAFKALIALIVMALPLFALPALFKASGNVLGRLHTMTNGGIKKYGGNQAQDLAKHYRGQLAAKTAANTRPGMLGKTGRFVAGYSGRRNFKMQQQKDNAQRLQQQHVAETVQGSDRFARRAAGMAGGEVGMARAQAAARSIVARQEAEAVKIAIDSMKDRGIDSDRGALEREIRTTQDGSVAKAATTLLLNTGGSENFRGLLYDQALMQRHGKSIIEAGRENYGAVDGKSPDAADFMAQANAVEIAQAGGAAADIDSQTRVMGLSGGKMIKFEPRTMARMFRRAATMSAADQLKLQEQAVLAMADKDFAQAKTATQEAIKAFAAGNFTTPPPSVVPTDASGAPLPQNQW